MRSQIVQMKKRNQKIEQKTTASVSRNYNSQSENLFRSKLSGKKLLIFKLLLAFFPVFLFLILEIGLRIANFGYPTSFLLERTKDGKKYFIENQFFGYRFFPSRLARTPEPFICLAEKPEKTYRIIVFGESAALGDPAPAYSFARMLETILNKTVDGVNFEVINVSMTAINSHVLLEIAKDCRKLKADLWLLYIGNNEVIGPFGPATVFTIKNLPYPIIRLIVSCKELKVFQLLQLILEKIQSVDLTFAEWAGMEMFMNSQIRFQDVVLNNVYINFEKNISRIIKLGLKSGSDVLLCAPIANYKDSAPFGSLNKNGLSESDLKQWREFFEIGKKHEEQGSPADALVYYKKAEAIDNTYAELLFRIARCLEKTGKDEDSIKLVVDYYIKAVDYDTMRFRPDSQILGVLESLGKSARITGSSHSENIVKFINSYDELNKCGIKIPGNKILWEHVHLNFKGNYLLASIYANAVREILKSKSHGQQVYISFKTNLVDETTIFADLGLTDYDKLKVYKEMEKRLSQPPFTYRCNQKEQLERLKLGIETLEKNTQSADVQKFVSEYTKLLDQRSGDYVLRQRFAELLDENGFYEMALEQWQSIKSLIPHYPNCYLQIGNLLDKMGRSLEAVPYFETALRMNMKSAEVYSSFGLCLLNLNRYDEAIDTLQKALNLKPNLPAIYVNLSLAFAAKGDIKTAKEQCLNAIKISPNYGAAYLNLGKYYAIEGNHELALSNYLKAVSIDNKNSIAYYNAANALSRLGRKQEALTNYLKAVELNPNFGEAHLNLAFEYLDLKDNESALRHFQTSAKLMTNNVIAQINCGIAFARAGRFNEALIYLERALQLDPSDPQIHYNLGLLFAKMGQTEKAVIEFSRTIELNPTHREAKIQLDKLLQKR